MGNSVCYKCLDRTTYCHSRCERYKLQQELNISRRNKQYRNQYSEIFGYDMESSKRKYGKPIRQW